MYCHVCDFVPVVFSWWSVEGQCTDMSVTFYLLCWASEVLKVSVLLCLRLSTSGVQLVECWSSVYFLCLWLSTSGVQLVKCWRSVYCYVCDSLPVMFSWWSVEGRCTFYVCDFLPVVFSWWSVEGQCTVMSVTFYQWCLVGEVLKVGVLFMSDFLLVVFSW